MDNDSIDKRVVCIIGAALGISTTTRAMDNFSQEVKLENVKTETRFAFEDWHGTKRSHERRNKQNAARARMWKNQRR